MERTTNHPQALIEGLEKRLMTTYMAELMAYALGYRESAYWFQTRRMSLKDDLNKLLKGVYNG